MASGSNVSARGPPTSQRSVDPVDEETTDRSRRSFPGVPMDHLASVEDVAEAFPYLASDTASYVTGHNLIATGA